jgi:hypothetical protein
MFNKQNSQAKNKAVSETQTAGLCMGGCQSDNLFPAKNTEPNRNNGVILTVDLGRLFLAPSNVPPVVEQPVGRVVVAHGIGGDRGVKHLECRETHQVLTPESQDSGKHSVGKSLSFQQSRCQAFASHRMSRSFNVIDSVGELCASVLKGGASF